MKMTQRISVAVAALGLTIVVANPGVAVAGEAADLAATTSGGITWIDVTVPVGDHEDVSIKIFNVTDRSTRMWQRCNFSFTGSGDYRCGIDSTRGSLAQKRGGSWVAKAFVDGALVAKKAFSL